MPNPTLRELRSEMSKDVGKNVTQSDFAVSSGVTLATYNRAEQAPYKRTKGPSVLVKAKLSKFLGRHEESIRWF